MQDEFARRRKQLAQEVLSGMRDWRVQHHRATFADIDEELDTRMARLRAGLLEYLAMAKGCTKSQAARFPLCLMYCGSL